MRVLMVGGSPEPVSARLVGRLARGCERIVAVDRGLDFLLAAGRLPDLFCGDADSVGCEGAELVAASERGGEGSFAVERYNPAKDYTDLSLALRAVRERWPGADLVCTGLAGGRPDHFLGCLGCLLSWEGAVELHEDAYEGRLLHGGSDWELSDLAGHRFSFVPLSETATVSIRGMRWELDHCEAALLSDLGISNVVTADPAQISCHAGAIGAWVFR